MEKINTKLKRLTALILTVAMVVSSNAFSSVNYAFANETETSMETQTETQNTESVEDSGQGNESQPETTGSVSTETEETESISSETTGETGESSGETTGQPEEETSEPVAESEETTAPAAVNSLEPRDGEQTTGFDMSLNVSTQTVLSGGTFRYTIGYTVPPLTDSGSYTGMSITFDLPENVHVAWNDETNDYAISGQGIQDVNVIEQTDGTSAVQIILVPDGITTGTARTIVADITTDNFEIEDGTVIQVTPKISGYSDQGTIDDQVPASDVEKAKVTVEAKDGWLIEKSAGTVDKSHDDYYLVPYTITVRNTRDGSTEADPDRNGRLEMESYKLTDILPTDYPEDGGAAEIVSVTMGNGTELQSGTDYTIDKNSDGSIKEIVIIKYATADSKLNYIDAGDPTATTYHIVVKYPRDPYKTDSNKPLVEYTLENTAKLEYALLGQEPQEKQDTAEVVLGEKEVASASHDIVIDKKMSIGSDSVAAGEEAAAFTLYMDQDCKNIALDVNGENPAGSEQYTDSNGQVTFRNLRPDTYYLKETDTPEGYTSIGVVQITLNSDGTVTVADDPDTITFADGKLSVVNVADTVGGVTFVKYAKDAEGKVAVQSGAVFQLSDGAKTYEATSDSTGRVSFWNIPEGTYSMKETEAPEGYDTSNVVIADITVSGNVMTDISQKAAKATGGASEEVNGFLNVSPMGKFQIKKVSSEEGHAALTGAKFKVYGPYESKPVEPDDEHLIKDGDSDYILTTGAGGIATSIALQAGWYLVEEVEAPQFYELPDKPYTAVEVGANGIKEITIENTPLVSVTFRKQGAVYQNGQEIIVEEMANVKFTIYDQAEGGEKIDEVTTKLDTTNNSTSDPIYLYHGRTYYYAEEILDKNSPYTPLPGRRAFTVVRGSSNEQVVEVKNHSTLGRIQIQKSDAVTGEDLANAVFAIWQSDSEGNKTGSSAVGTITTDEKGYGISGWLNPGNYVLEETTAPYGYAKRTDLIKVSVTEGTQNVPIQIENEPLKSIQVKKVDGSGKPLKGATFQIFEGELAQGLLLGTAVTDENGFCTFTNLKPGKTYSIKELSAPEGYTKPAAPSENGQIIVVTTPKEAEKAEDNVVIVADAVTNYKKVNISFTKYSDMDGKKSALAGAEFTLYEWNGTEKGNKVSSATSDASGKVTFEGIDYMRWDDDGGWKRAQYYLEETKVPDGHAETTGRVITVSKNGTIIDITDSSEPSTLISIVDDANKGKIAIEKYAAGEDGTADQEHPLSATFGIYSDEACENKIATIQTDAEGSGLSGWLDEGTYYLKELSVESEGNYTIDTEPKKIKVKAGETNDDFTGEKALVNIPQGKVTISKKASFQIVNSDGSVTDDWQKYDLQGAVFELYKKTGTGTNSMTEDVANGEPVAKIDLTNSASSTSDWLDAGEYWLVEVTVPDGYKMKEDTATEVQKDGKTVYVLNNPCIIKAGVTDTKVEVENVNDKGKIRLTKTAFNDPDYLLNGAEFELYVEDEAGTPTVIDAGGKTQTVHLKKVEGSISSDGNGTTLESGTNGDGQAVTADLEPGKTYYLKEISTEKVKPVTGYIDVEWLWYYQWTGPIKVSANREVQVTISNYYMEGDGTKKDSSEQPLEGAVFGAFEDADSAGAMVNYIKAHYIDAPASPNSGREKFEKDLEDPKFLSEKGIVEVSTPSGADGQFSFHTLVPGKDYYIIELLPPDGYSIDTENTENTIKKVTVNADGEGFTPSISFTDYELGQLQVLKWTTIGNKTYNVEGVEFNVYPAKEDPVNGTYKKDEGDQYYAKAEDIPIAVGKSDANGLYTSILLPQGTYIVEESSVDGAGGVVSKGEDSYRVIDIVANATNKDYTEAEKGSGFYNPAAYGKFLLKKTLSSDAYYSNRTVTFKVQKRDEDDQEWTDYLIGNNTSEFTVTVNNQYESPFMPAGEYRIYETKADGMTITCDEEQPIEFTIVGGQYTGSTEGNTNIANNVDSDEPIVVSNTPQGKLTIEKVGVFNNNDTEGDQEKTALSGAQFQLYRVEDGQETLVGDTVTTGTDGKATWDSLDAGEYVLKEVSAPTGYSKDRESYEVTIEAGKETSLTGGEAIRNYTQKGKIQIKKIDAESKKELSGAIYGVYSDEECENKVTEIVTGENGVGLSDLLDTGSYYIKEISAPTGYLLNDTVQQVTVESNKTVQATNDFTDDLEFKLQIRKVHGKDNQTPVSGAKIGLYATEADASAGTDPISEKTTGANGQILFEGLKAGTYYYKELEVPSGFIIDQTVHSIQINYESHKANVTVK